MGAPPLSSGFLTAGVARAWVGEPARTHAGSGASAFAFAPRAFSLGRPRPMDERRRKPKSQKSSSGSDTTNILLKTRKGVVRGRTPKAQTTKAKTHTNY